MRLIDADALENEVDTWCYSDYDKFDFLEAIDKAPTVESYTYEQVKELVDLNKKLSEERQISNDELMKFARFVAKEVLDNNFKENADSFAELSCRRLVKLGLVKLDGDTYKGVDE